MRREYAPKGQQTLAQGNALGSSGSGSSALKGQKHHHLHEGLRLVMLLPLQGATLFTHSTQGVALGYRLNALSGRNI